MGRRARSARRWIAVALCGLVAASAAPALAGAQVKVGGAVIAAEQKQGAGLGVTVAKVKAEVQAFDPAVAWERHTFAGLAGFLGLAGEGDATFAVSGYGGEAVEVGMVFTLRTANEARRDGELLRAVARSTIGERAALWVTGHRKAFNAHRRLGVDVIRARLRMQSGEPTLALMIEPQWVYAIQGNAGGIG